MRTRFMVQSTPTNSKGSIRILRTGRGERLKASALRMHRIVGAMAGAAIVGVGVKPMAGADVTSAEAASAAVVFAVAGASDGRQHFGKN